MDPKDKNGNKTYPQQFFRQLKLKFDVCKLQKHACEQCPFSACLAVCILRLACAAQVSYVISKCFPALHIGKDRIKMTASWGVQTPSKKTSPVAQILIKGWIMGRYYANNIKRLFSFLYIFLYIAASLMAHAHYFCCAYIIIRGSCYICIILLNMLQFDIFLT